MLGGTHEMPNKGGLTMLGRHFGQCLWGAINAGGGHGLIAHQATLVGHLVGATQHFVFLVWGGRARGKTCGDHDRTNQCYYSFHMTHPLARTDIREIPGQNRASERLRQAQIPPGASKRRSKPAVNNDGPPKLACRPETITRGGALGDRRKILLPRRVLLMLRRMLDPV